MGLPIILSETAILTFDVIAAQVLQPLGNKAHQDFKKNTLKTLGLIANNPFIYKQVKLIQTAAWLSKKHHEN